MASEQQKTTYTAAEVAVLEETILKQKAEIDELKRKLEHMNEVFANASVPGSVSPVRKTLMYCRNRPACSTKRNPLRTTRQKNPSQIPFSLRHTSGKRNAVRLKC